MALPPVNHQQWWPWCCRTSSGGLVSDAHRAGERVKGADPPTSEENEDRYLQVRQLIKQAIEMPTPDGIANFLNFSTTFRRLGIWNARMAYIQRPGARIIASEYEWKTVSRSVVPDAIPIMILWPFSPIRYVYELEDTEPRIDREDIKDPFRCSRQVRSSSATGTDGLATKAEAPSKLLSRGEGRASVMRGPLPHTVSDGPHPVEDHWMMAPALANLRVKMRPATMSKLPKAFRGIASLSKTDWIQRSALSP